MYVIFKKNQNHKRLKLLKFHYIRLYYRKNNFFQQLYEKYRVYFKCLLENSRNDLPKVHFVMYNL